MGVVHYGEIFRNIDRKVATFQIVKVSLKENNSARGTMSKKKEAWYVKAPASTDIAGRSPTSIKRSYIRYNVDTWTRKKKKKMINNSV